MKILIVGFGSIARKHYQALLKIDPSIKVIAFRSNTNAEQIKDILSIFNTEEIKQYAPYDFVLISNPTYKHKETIDQLLNLRCPLFIEKPLFHTIQSDKFITKIHACDVITYVACNLRYLDSLLYVKEVLLPKLVINEVNVYCGSFLPEWRTESDYHAVYSAHSDQGGGVHLDLIHELDYVYWFFGKPVQVHAYKTSKSSLNIDAIDYANYILEYNDFSVNIILNYFRKDKKRSIELVCMDDTYTVNLLSNSVSSTKEIVFESNQEISDTYLKQMQYFVNSIKIPKETCNTIMNGIDEAYEVLKICLINEIK